MIGLTQHMIRQQGKYNGTDFTRLDTFCPGRLEIPEFQGLLKRLAGQRLILPLAGAGQKLPVFLCKRVGGLYQLIFRGIE